MPVAFDTSGMEQYDERTWFCPRTGDQVSLTYIDLVPDLPAPLDDLPLLRHRLALETAEVGALIEAHVVMIDSVPALYQLLKLPIPDRDSGQAFIAAFTVPKATCSVVLRVQCAEGETTGVRESAVIAQVGPEAFVRPHPYAPALEGRLPWHVGDEERWDGRFPEHPLSRARAWANKTVNTARIDPAFAQLPTFRPGGPGPNDHTDFHAPVERPALPPASSSSSASSSAKSKNTGKQPSGAHHRPDKTPMDVPSLEAPSLEESTSQMAAQPAETPTSTSTSRRASRHAKAEEVPPPPAVRRSKLDSKSAWQIPPTGGGDPAPETIGARAQRTRRAVEEAANSQSNTHRMTSSDDPRPEASWPAPDGAGRIVSPNSTPPPFPLSSTGGDRAMTSNGDGARQGGFPGAGPPPPSRADAAQVSGRMVPSTPSGTFPPVSPPSGFPQASPVGNALPSASSGGSPGTNGARPGAYPDAAAGPANARQGAYPDGSSGTPGAHPGTFPDGSSSTVNARPGAFPGTSPGTSGGRPGTFPESTPRTPGRPGAYPEIPAASSSAQPGAFPKGANARPGTFANGSPGAFPDSSPGTTGVFPESTPGGRTGTYPDATPAPSAYSNGSPGATGARPGAFTDAARASGNGQPGAFPNSTNGHPGAFPEVAPAVGNGQPGSFPDGSPGGANGRPGGFPEPPSRGRPGAFPGAPGNGGAGADVGATIAQPGGFPEIPPASTRSGVFPAASPSTARTRELPHSATNGHPGGAPPNAFPDVSPSAINGYPNALPELPPSMTNGQVPPFPGATATRSGIFPAVSPGAFPSGLPALPPATGAPAANGHPAASGTFPAVPPGNGAFPGGAPNGFPDPAAARSGTFPPATNGRDSFVGIAPAFPGARAFPDNSLDSTNAHPPSAVGRPVASQGAYPSGTADPIGPPQAMGIQPPRPLSPPMPRTGEPPVGAGDVMHTVLIGLPIGGYVPLWHDNAISYWRMTDPTAIRARLGVGIESRSEIDNRRFREAALFTPERNTLFLTDRFRNTQGNLGGASTQLIPATEDEAYRAATDKAMSEFYSWIGDVVVSAGQRGEYVAIETGGWHVPVTPVVLIMLRSDGREWHSVVETSPVPHGAPVWRDQQPVDGDTQLLASPATDRTMRAAGLLTRFAVATWPMHPFQLGLSFGPNPTLGDVATR